MKFILLDTNAWMELLRDDHKGELISHLENWVSQEGVTLLVPEIVLKTEWPKIKGIHLENVKKAHSTTIKTGKSGEIPIHSLIHKAYNNVIDTVDRIERLIKNATHYGYNEKVSKEVLDRQLLRRPPFHQKRESTQDAILYFSTIEFLKGINISGFVFVSGDTDFSDIDNPQELHVDLKPIDVEIAFFTNLHLAIHKLKEDLPEKKLSKNTHDNDFVSEFHLEKIPNANNLIDSLHTALNAYNDQIAFIPLEILRRVFPLKAPNKKYPFTDYAAYGLSTNNDALIELLRHVTISNMSKLEITDEARFVDCLNSQSKLEDIYRKLNDNLIQEIHLLGGSKEINIRFLDMRVCGCTRCTFHRLDYMHSLQELSFVPGFEIRESMKHAFIHFQFGSFVRSLYLFYDAYKKSVEQKKGISAIICLHNLKKLKGFISAYVTQKSEELNKLLHEISKISTSVEMHLLEDQNEFVIENCKWLNESKYLYSASTAIDETCRKIRDHYDLQIRGGWSNNSNLWLLICQFEEFENYLEQNFIVCSRSEIASLFEPVIEGILMCLLFNEKQGGRLAYLNNYLLIKAIKYINADSFLKLTRRYGVQSIKYTADKHEIWSIDQIVVGFLQSYSNMLQLADEKIEGDHFYFQDRCRNLLQNLFAVMAMVESDSQYATDIVRAFVGITRNNKVMRSIEYGYFILYLQKKAKHITVECLYELLQTAIQDEQYHDHRIFATIRTLAETDKFNAITISDETSYGLVLQNFFNCCPLCKQFHREDCLVHIYYLLSSDFKSDLLSRLDTIFRDEFDPDLFYKFSIFGVVDYNKFLPKYFEYFEEVQIHTKDQESWFMGRTESFLRRFSDLLNLAFKYNLDTNSRPFVRYKGVSDYYDWILDLENFDYEKFHIEWILEYPTDFYFKRIFSSVKLKAEIKKILNRESHPEVARLFVKHTV